MLRVAALRISISLVPALAIAACVTINVPKVTPGAYPNYREMLVAQLEAVPFNAPREFIHSYGICGADVMADNLTPAELDRLDRYARGELKISDSELKKIDDDLRSRIGGQGGLMSEMRERCPEVVKEAEAYKKAHAT
jgi:hypothetical protein